VTIMISKRPIVLIKLGGSVITNKEKSMTLRVEVLKRLVGEILRARSENPNTLFIVGHGQGSFAHVPAAKYKTMQGFIGADSLQGMAIVQDLAAQLNRIVVKEFLDAGLPAVSLYPSNSLVTKKRAASKCFMSVLEEYLNKGLLPVTCGDVIVDEEQGCTIWSTEEVLAFFARELAAKGWNIDKLVHVVEVDGFYDENKKVVPEITEKNWPEVQKALTATRGVDVTGGMGLKVEESLAIAKLGIPSFIISGLKKDNLYHLLADTTWLGTRII
jgi:isopentenyl phosphate kinase